MTVRDIRIVNMAEGQKIESDKVIKRIGEISYRDMGVLSKIGLFDTGKALITSGLRVITGGGMTVVIPTGSILQRTPGLDLMPCIGVADQTLTLDAASGISRIDMVECQVKSVIDKNDTASSVLDATTGVISVANIKRDIKYYLSVQKKTSSVTATAATAAVLTGTVAIAGTIDLSAYYLLNMADGEDGSFQEIDLRGAVPAATTLAEIIANINAAVGRTMASVGGGNTAVLTGDGIGITSFFEIKPPVTDSGADALQTVFGVSGAGAYDYIYQGVNDWIKLAEIDIGAVTTVITPAMIRNVDDKSTWASDSTNVITAPPSIQPVSLRTAQNYIANNDLFAIETSSGKSLQVSGSVLKGETYYTSASYVILDNDGYINIFVNASSADRAVTLPLKTNNQKRLIRIMFAKDTAGTHKVTISPDAADSSTLSGDGLASIILPKVGNYVEFIESQDTGMWEIVNERITSQLRLNTHAGYGSNDTMIPRYTNSSENIGNMFSENHSTGYNSNAEGLKITALRSGRYGFQGSHCAPSGSNTYMGFSLNSSQLTTVVSAITAGTRIGCAYTPVNVPNSVSIPDIYLKKGDIFRFHTNGGTPVTVALCDILVTYLGQ